ncbi:Hypothetical protein PHPALM_10612 [Phytophthora palmivora]|uniref:Retrotransposon gag domain-containing protein n=1 Tax=Phytophthora palmivora TaxID=4796 RepID=A0A2P4Y4A9_9STRA|nr:Hypothetical protein PHPALM_10612 [Phytophthora palmivora]
MSSEAAEAVVSTLHQVQQLTATMARLDEKVSAGHPSSQGGQLQRELDEAKREALDAERRAPSDVCTRSNRPRRLNRERREAATAQHLQQRQAEADAKLEAERAAWMAQVQQGLEDVERKLKVLEIVREEERVTARNIQEFQAGQIRDLRASSAQVQSDYATTDPKPATTTRANSGDSKRVTMSQDIIMGKGTGDQSQSGLKNVPRTVLDQLRATLPEADFARIAGSVGPKEIKTEIHASAAAAGASKTQRRTKALRSAAKTLTRGRGKLNTRLKRKKSTHKQTRRNNDPSESSGSSGSESEADSSSDDDLGEAVKSSLAMPFTSKAGNTMITFRPYINSATLGMFDEKTPIGDRKNWWEKFINMTTPKHVLQDWKRMSTEFRRMYLMAVKADVRFRKSKKERGEHIKRFIKNLRDSQLKVVLRNQRFRYLEDLEFVLKQNEDLGLDGGYDSSSSQKRDFRADNATPTRFKSSSRAFVSVSEDEGGWESEGHVRFDDEMEEVSAKPEVKVAERGALVGSTPETGAQSALSEQDIRSAVYRAMESAGWRPPQSSPQ